MVLKSLNRPRTMLKSVSIQPRTNPPKSLKIRCSEWECHGACQLSCFSHPHCETSSSAFDRKQKSFQRDSELFLSLSLSISPCALWAHNNFVRLIVGFCTRVIQFKALLRPKNGNNMYLDVSTTSFGTLRCHVSERHKIGLLVPLLFETQEVFDSYKPRKPGSTAHSSQLNAECDVKYAPPRSTIDRGGGAYFVKFRQNLIKKF